ncbi:Crp/Fnr family transcriptional regulator [Aquimarina litoralis]|uniref:Crp/Fnr family transcriptional regulator n=1 Tax=Aquimarina litoralis TaxID=584605 RepID=UPI001C58BBDD|nr:Crp/Fnr family transcriptional regulator [Aquimarina litoralis]MBW1294986.1 cyclic nucleotide-binding domain-containing protein [Aquimarina litoralis]
MSSELILKNIGRFIELTQEEQDLYVSLLKEKKLKKKEFLLRPGEIARYNYFTAQGCLKIYKIDNNGTEHITMFAIKDWWSGDLASYITQQPSNYFIQALEDSEVLLMSKENFDLLFEKIPKFERFYRILYQRSLVSFIQQSDQNISLNAEERYYNFIKKYPSLIHRISQKNIAAYLGVTPEFLSVLRKKLSSK